MLDQRFFLKHLVLWYLVGGKRVVSRSATDIIDELINE